MFCKHCGARLEDGARFCMNCGYDQTDTHAPRESHNPAFGERPGTYLVLSIIVTLCCCVPFGIIGIIYATRVDPAWNSGLYEDARNFSRKARNWSLWGAVLSVLFWIVYIILIAAGVAWASWWDAEDLFCTQWIL